MDGPISVYLSESSSIYSGDGRNRKHQALIEGEVKTLPFLKGFTRLQS
jgi:hypothetical protein